MWTQQEMDKVSNRSMNNVWSLLKVSYKDNRTTFLLLPLNKFHTSFGGLKWWYRNYLCKFFWLKLSSQYLLRCIMYYSLRYYKEETQLVGLFFTKGVLEFVVKILDKYTSKEFPKRFLSKTEIINLSVSASNNSCIHISWINS